MLHRVLAFAVQLVSLDMRDLHVSLLQQQEPGPDPSDRSHLRGRDAVHVDIRSLSLQPQGENLKSAYLFDSMLRLAAHGPRQHCLHARCCAARSVDAAAALTARPVDCTAGACPVLCKLQSSEEVLCIQAPPARLMLLCLRQTTCLPTTLPAPQRLMQQQLLQCPTGCTSCVCLQRYASAVMRSGGCLVCTCA